MKEYNRIAQQRSRLRRAGVPESELPKLPTQPRKAKMTAPSKSELYAQNEALIKENIELNDKLSAQKRSEWDNKRDRAYEVFYSVMKPMFGSFSRE